jgi:hypothetical protein
MDQQLQIGEPGLIRISQPLVWMAGIQLKSIVDRLSEIEVSQKAGGDDMMASDGGTFSKINYKAIKGRSMP